MTESDRLRAQEKEKTLIPLMGHKDSRIGAKPETVFFVPSECWEQVASTIPNLFLLKLFIKAIHKTMSRSISPNGNQLARGRKKKQAKGDGIPVRFNPAIPKEKRLAFEKAVRKYFADLAEAK